MALYSSFAGLLWLLPRLLATVASVVVLLGLYLWSSVQTWKRHYARQVPRSNPTSPSHRAKPELKSRPPTPSSLHRPPTRRRSVSGCPASPFFGEEEDVSEEQEKVPVVPKDQKVQRAMHMDMDHIHLTLPQCLWFSLRVGLPSTFVGLWGLLRLRTYQLLIRKGWIPEPSAAKMQKMAFHLAVDVLASNFQCLERSEDGEEVARFHFLVPFYEDTKEGALEFHEQQVLDLAVNLEQKRVATSRLNGTEVSLVDTVLLLAHIASHVSHVKVHAYANWGVDPELAEQDAYFRTMSLITVCYNHLGFDNAPKLMNTLVSPEAGAAMKECFVAALKQGVPEHGDVVRLMPHSKHVSFLVKVRHHFQEAFEKFRSDLPASISCEGYFLGTVLHALDHDAYNDAVDWVAYAALRPSARFRSLHLVGQVVGFLISDDIPTVGLPKYYKDSKTNFHRRVYAAARLIDPERADQMQTCIIK